MRLLNSVAHFEKKNKMSHEVEAVLDKRIIRRKVRFFSLISTDTHFFSFSKLLTLFRIFFSFSNIHTYIFKTIKYQYLIKFVGFNTPEWTDASCCSCVNLIEEYHDREYSKQDLLIHVLETQLEIAINRIKHLEGFIITHNGMFFIFCCCYIVSYGALSTYSFSFHR